MLCAFSCFFPNTSVFVISFGDKLLSCCEEVILQSFFGTAKKKPSFSQAHYLLFYYIFYSYMRMYLLYLLLLIILLSVIFHCSCMCVSDLTHTQPHPHAWLQNGFISVLLMTDQTPLKHEGKVPLSIIDVCLPMYTTHIFLFLFFYFSLSVSLNSALILLQEYDFFTPEVEVFLATMQLI